MRYNTVKNILLAIAVLGAFPACASKQQNQDPQGRHFYERNFHQENLNQVEPFRAEVGGDYRDYPDHNLMRPQVAGQSAGKQSQAGSFLSHERAQKQAQYLIQANSGASSWVERAVVGRQTFYRVLVNRACQGLINQRGVGCFEVGGE